MAYLQLANIGAMSALKLVRLMTRILFDDGAGLSGVFNLSNFELSIRKKWNLPRRSRYRSALSWAPPTHVFG